MTMEMYLPVGYFHAVLGFGGAAIPNRAAVTFAGKDEGTATTPGDIATAIITAWGTHVDPLVCSVVSLSSCRVKLGPMEDGPFAEVATSNPGGVVTSSSPPSVAVLVRKITGIGGKVGQGRMYVPGLPESEVDEAGTITAARRSAWETGWQAFRAALASAELPMHLAHTAGTYVNSKKELVVVPARDPTLVTALTVDAKIATQRRRLRR